jgi:histone-lysine N-methyltransferase SETMAR
MVRHSKPTAGPIVKRQMLLQDNTHPLAAARTQAMLQEFVWEVFEHPAYSPDLALSDFHLFPKFKEFLGGRHFKSDEEV